MDKPKTFRRISPPFYPFSLNLLVKLHGFFIQWHLSLLFSFVRTMVSYEKKLMFVSDGYLISPKLVQEVLRKDRAYCPSLNPITGLVSIQQVLDSKATQVDWCLQVRSIAMGKLFLWYFELCTDFRYHGPWSDWEGRRPD